MLVRVHLLIRNNRLRNLVTLLSNCMYVIYSIENVFTSPHVLYYCVVLGKSLKKGRMTQHCPLDVHFPLMWIS